MTKKGYTAADISTLDIMEAIRLRPGMYLGSADNDGVEVAVREVIDNAVDEHLNGHGDRIYIAVDPETGVIGVEDRARGIPVEEHHKHPGKSTLEVVLTQAHSGGKFGTSYGVSGGLHGTGLKAVTATSTNLRATVWRDAQEHVLVFKDAKVVQKLTSTKLPAADKTKTGTRIEFRLDPTVFKDATSTIPDRENLRRMLRERAYLNPGLRLYLKWGKEKEELFHEKDGIDAYVLALAGEKSLFKKAAHFENPVDSDVRVAVAVAWTSGYGRDAVQGFCNCVRQAEGGTHVQGLRMALPQIVRAYVENNGILSAKDKDLKIEGQDCFEGVVAIVSIKHKSPVFKGQAKSALSNSDAQGAVQKAVNAGLAQWLEENPKEARMIANRAIAAAKARIAASKAREQVRKQDAGTFGMRNFGKLKDCSSRDISVNELFIVEGDSAGGSASLGRDRTTQAIYGLKGKPLNTWEADATRIFSNAEMSDLAASIGTGLFTEGMPEEELEAAMAKLRYGKVVILSDADIDGSHIECLLLGHFLKHMRPLIERGHIYIGLPPLFRVTERGKHSYLKDDAALAAFFRRRAAKVVGDDKALLALAARATAVVTAFGSVAGSIGASPSDLSHAIDRLIEVGEVDDPVYELASKIAEVREAEGCESVEGSEVSPGVFAVSGLEPSGRYFTTIVSQEFVQAVETAYTQVAALIGDEFAQALAARVGEINGKECRHILDYATVLEAEARKGIAVQRIKGLGEMNDDELGETTLDVNTRRMIQVAVTDFSETGEFVGSMLSKGTVEARQQIVRNSEISRELVDA